MQGTLEMQQTQGMKQAEVCNLGEAARENNYEQQKSNRCRLFNTTKLYGRNNELLILQNAFEECTTSDKRGLVLIKGASGTGKTSLADALQPAVQRRKGFFISGKFELSRNQNPFAAFCAAFTQWTHLVMGNIARPQDERLAQIRDAVCNALGEEGKLLTDMIPSLETVVGPQDETCEVAATEAVERFRFVFCNFCHAIASIAPLVMVLDDLQWSDTASLDLLNAILLHPTPPSTLLVIGTFRDDNLENEKVKENESKTSSCVTDSEKSTFRQYLQEKKWIEAPPASLQVSLIPLAGLQLASLNEMVAEALGVPLTDSATVAQWLHSNCGGNAFHTLQWLRLLRDRGIVRKGEGAQNLMFREYETGGLCLDHDQSADDLIVSEILKLSGFAQETLKVSACLGDEFEEYSLTLLLGGKTDDISQALKDFMAKSMVIYLPNLVRYRFRHDRIRQAILSLIDNVDNFQFECGYKLWQHSSDHFRYAKIFAIASLMLKGMSNEMVSHNQLELAKFYHDAGVKASSLAAFADASRYLEAGIELVKGRDCWLTEYDFCLSLYNSAVDAELCIQRFDCVKKLVHEILANARSSKDKVTAYTAMINMAGQQGSVQEAVVVGLDVLKQLGVKLPSNPSTFCIVKDIIRTKLSVGGRSNYDILSLPPMQDETKLAAMHVLHNLIPCAFNLGSPCLVLIGTTLVRLTMKHGISKLSSLGFVTLAWLLCRNDRKEGFRFGQLALSIVEKMRTKEFITRVHEHFYYFVHHWMRPLAESLDPLQAAYKVGISVGDVEFANYAAASRAAHSLFAGMHLTVVEGFYTEVIAQLTRYKQTNSLLLAQPHLQYLHNLTGRAPEPRVLSGLVFAPKDRAAENVILQVICCGLGADLALLFGDSDLAQELSEQRRNSKLESFAMYTYALDSFVDGLIAGSKARFRNRCNRRNVKDLRKSVQNLSRWAKDCPQNFLHKEKLLEAELRSLKSSETVCMHVLALYEESIREGLRHGFYQDAARASELAGDYLERQQDHIRAEEFWSQACGFYQEWGASAKAAHLRNRMIRLPSM